MQKNVKHTSYKMAESNQYDNQLLNTIKSFLSLVDITLKKNQININVLFELKTLLTNFSLSFKDQGYVNAIIANDYLNQMINSILHSFDTILKNFFENSKIIK